MDVGVLLIRLLVGLLFVGHGTQKLFGWFGGPGLHGTRGWIGSLGYPYPRISALALGIGELAGGLLLALGLLTPIGGTIIAALMLSAIASVHASKGLWVTQGGMEYPLVLAALGLMFAFTGAGRYSLDAVLGSTFAGWRAGLAATLAAMVIAFAGTVARNVRGRQASGEQRRAA